MHYTLFIHQTFSPHPLSGGIIDMSFCRGRKQLVYIDMPCVGYPTDLLV